MGDALFGETPVRYGTEVTEAQESGAGIGRWTIRYSNGGATGGILSKGNVQVHS